MASNAQAVSSGSLTERRDHGIGILKMSGESCSQSAKGCRQGRSLEIQGPGKGSSGRAVLDVASGVNEEFQLCRTEAKQWGRESTGSQGLQQETGWRAEGTGAHGIQPGVHIGQ